MKRTILLLMLLALMPFVSASLGDVVVNYKSLVGSSVLGCNWGNGYIIGACFNITGANGLSNISGNTVLIKNISINTSTNTGTPLFTNLTLYRTNSVGTPQWTQQIGIVKPLSLAVSSWNDLRFNSTLNLTKNITYCLGLGYTATTGNTDYWRWFGNNGGGSPPGITKVAAVSGGLWVSASQGAALLTYDYTMNIVITEYSPDITPPKVTFDMQQPTDINSTNIITSKANITYNITDDIELSNSSIKLYYKTNDSTTDYAIFLNGTIYRTQLGFFGMGFSSNKSSTYLWQIWENEILPGTYNYDEVLMEATPHNKLTLATQNSFVKTEFLNVSNTKQYGIFEIMSNRTASGGTSASIYYCNSSYTLGQVETDTSCFNFYTQPPTTLPNHVHSAYSNHLLIPFYINTTTGNTGNVHVTPTSYFVFGGSSTDWDVYNIPVTVRSTTTATTVNRGNSWNAQAFTFDSHLHQYNVNASFWYYACANDTSDNAYCSELREDLLRLGGLSPTGLSVIVPAQGTYSGFININYTRAVSPNNYPIILYNITLLYANETFESVITKNNSVNLNYSWNSRSVIDGEYIVKVHACDDLNQCIYALSSNFTIYNNASENFIPISILFAGLLIAMALVYAGARTK